MYRQTGPSSSFVQVQRGKVPRTNRLDPVLTKLWSPTQAAPLAAVLSPFQWIGWRKHSDESVETHNDLQGKINKLMNLRSWSNILRWKMCFAENHKMVGCQVLNGSQLQHKVIEVRTSTWLQMMGPDATCFRCQDSKSLKSNFQSMTSRWGRWAVAKTSITYTNNSIQCFCHCSGEEIQVLRFAVNSWTLSAAFFFAQWFCWESNSSDWKPTCTSGFQGQESIRCLNHWKSFEIWEVHAQGDCLESRFASKLTSAAIIGFGVCAAPRKPHASCLYPLWQALLVLKVILDFTILKLI